MFLVFCLFFKINYFKVHRCYCVLIIQGRPPAVSLLKIYQLKTFRCIIFVIYIIKRIAVTISKYCTSKFLLIDKRTALIEILRPILRQYKDLKTKKFCRGAPDLQLNLTIGSLANLTYDFQIASLIYPFMCFY